MISRTISLSASLALMLGGLMPLAASEIVIGNNQTIAFLGDSITAAGWGDPAGYCQEVVAGLASAGITVKPLPAGIGGQTSKDMLARLDHDILSKKPDWMTLSCGVNDVWHGVNGVDLDGFKKNVTAILDACAAAKVKVVVLTATPITEKLDFADNQKLVPYNDFLRDIANQRKLPLADLNADIQAAIRAKTPGSPPLTVDGVHMANAGNLIMGHGVLLALGLSEEQAKHAEESFVDQPGTVQDKTAQLNISIRQYAVLERAAAAAGKPMNAYLGELLKKQIEPLIANASKGAAAPTH